MRFDAENDPYAHLNDRDVLDDTPIGTLRVMPDEAGVLSVWLMDKSEPDEGIAPIHVLAPNENPLNAIYGKRVFEQQLVNAMFRRNIEIQRARHERDQALLQGDFKRDLQRFAEEHHQDAGEAVGLVLRGGD